MTINCQLVWNEEQKQKLKLEESLTRWLRAMQSRGGSSVSMQVSSTRGQSRVFWGIWHLSNKISNSGFFSPSFYHECILCECVPVISPAPACDWSGQVQRTTLEATPSQMSADCAFPSSLVRWHDVGGHWWLHRDGLPFYPPVDNKHKKSQYNSMFVCLYDLLCFSDQREKHTSRLTKDWIPSTKLGEGVAWPEERVHWEPGPKKYPEGTFFLETWNHCQKLPNLKSHSASGYIQWLVVLWWVPHLH